jgi:hypothetical protein
MSKRAIVAVVVILMILWTLLFSCTPRHSKYEMLYKDKHYVHLMNKETFNELTIKRKY